jgi:hypothetical protein
MQYFLYIKYSRHNYSPLFHSLIHSLTIPCLLSLSIGDITYKWYYSTSFSTSQPLDMSQSLCTLFNFRSCGTACSTEIRSESWRTRGPSRGCGEPRRCARQDRDPIHFKIVEADFESISKSRTSCFQIDTHDTYDLWLDVLHMHRKLRR